MNKIPLGEMYKRHTSSEKQSVPQSRFQELTFKVFELNPEGKELLNLWKEAYINQPRFLPSMDSSIGYFRSGQESIVLNMLDFIKEQKVIIESEKIKGENV